MAPLKLLIGAFLLIFASSCAAPHLGTSAEDMWEGGPDDGEQEEFDVLEHFEEHPLDPMNAGTGELCSLPGFPRSLAERIVQARSKARSMRKLLEELTPPEREALRRYEPYITLPGRRPVRFEARVTVDRFGVEGGRREDMRCTLEEERLRLSGRYADAYAYRLYAAGRLYRGHVRVHGGDFAPDLAVGLLYSSYSSTYPFSSGYHIRKMRWIAGRMSFYGPSMRGAAVEVWAGCAHLLAFRGSPCSYKGGRIETSGALVTGGRLEFTKRGLSMGATACTDETSSRSLTVSIDASLIRERFEAAGELIVTGEGTGCVFGCSTRRGRGEASLFLYGMHSFSSRAFGRPLQGRYPAKRGASLVLRRGIRAGIEVLSAFEHGSSSNVIEERSRDLVRLECRWSARRHRVKVSYSRRIDSRSIMVPYPPGGVMPPEVSSSLGIVQTSRIRKSLRVRVSIRAPLEREGSGYLICPSITLEHAVRATLSWAVHRATSGSPLFYCYERSLDGLYPWRALRGDGWRVALFGGMSVGPIRLAFFCAAQQPGGREAGLQAGTSF